MASTEKRTDPSAVRGSRFKKDLDKQVGEFLASVGFDHELAWADIAGSMAHASMLGAVGLISEHDSALLAEGLRKVWNRIGSEGEVLDVVHEDIHMNVEVMLRREIGPAASLLHSGRSRNDQVALDLRIYNRERIAVTVEAVVSLQETLLALAGRASGTVLQGHTHLQGAQPVLLAHVLLAHFERFQRDIQRLEDAFERLNISPLGAGALAGTGLGIDPAMTAHLLGFKAGPANSLDAVSDRDHVFEVLSGLSLIAIHLSQLAEEVVLWCSKEFGLARLDDTVSTGSSMMPQKRNPDIFELVRGKTGRVVGHLMAMATVLKGLPLAYNKDLQEDKEALFDAFGTVIGGLKATVLGLKGLTFIAGDVDIDPGCYATDLCEHLVLKGVPFREAHGTVGKLMLWCEDNGIPLDKVDIDVLKGFDKAFDEGCLALLTPQGSVKAKVSSGGTGPDMVSKALAKAFDTVEDDRVILEGLWRPTMTAGALLRPAKGTGPGPNNKLI